LSYIIPLILNGKKRPKRPKLTKLWKLSRTILIPHHQVFNKVGKKVLGKLVYFWYMTSRSWFLLAKFTAISQYLSLHFVCEFHNMCNKISISIQNDLPPFCNKNQRLHLILVAWLSKNMFLSFELLKDIKVFIKITTILFHDNNAFRVFLPSKSLLLRVDIISFYSIQVDFRVSSKLFLRILQFRVFLVVANVVQL